ncbi:hypothetical protein TELCIR_22916 [Teladorsagia circumcincta]|uniref:Uncharacterized protein n=1 Tax=Teladorsagia circumcincta TaxID=45464 RepID=A0A2G9TCK6_TELCI|nr:hypothetical protein TELCIR_22916 [Teladorsagia circumcincta]
MAYKKIVQSVDASQKYGKVDHMENFGAELRAVNRQLINIFNIMLNSRLCILFWFHRYLHFVIKNMEEDDDKDSHSNVLSFKEMAEKSE